MFRAAYSLAFRQRQINSSDVGQITLMSPGDIIFLYSDGVYDGSDKEARAALESIVQDHKHRPAKDICNTILEYALEQDEYLKRIGEADRIDDKTALIIKHG
jgi:serine phosphatase RsbU (regulator of sigma subunit)